MSNLRPITNQTHSKNPSRQAQKSARYITITSGKGGVGKTITSINLALAARRMGLRVLILDGDMGLANVDVVLGLQPRYNIRDVLNGHANIREIIVDGPHGLKIVPSGSGFAQLTRLSELQKQILSEQLRALEDDFDVMFVDTGAGINEQVTDFNCAAQDIVIVTTPEPHAMTDAYALIKVLHQDYKLNKFNLLVNMVRSDEQGTKVSSRISEVSDKYLGIRVNYLGCVPMDNQVQMLILNRMAGSDQLIHTLAGQAWNRVALNFFNAKDSPKEKDQEDFWQKLLWTTQDNRAIRNTII